MTSSREPGNVRERRTQGSANRSATRLARSVRSSPGNADAIVLKTIAAALALLAIVGLFLAPLLGIQEAIEGGTTAPTPRVEVSVDSDWANAIVLWVILLWPLWWTML